MPVIDTSIAVACDKSIARYPSDSPSTNSSTVASKAQLKIFSDIISRIIIPRKIHILNDAFHFEILVKSQKITGYRIVGVEDWANFNVEPEYIYIEDPSNSAVLAEVRKVIDAAACSLDEGKLQIERLSPHEKSLVSARSTGIYPADAIAAELSSENKTPPKPSSVVVEKQIDIKSEATAHVEMPSLNADQESIGQRDAASVTSQLIEEFFEKLKDKSNFVYLQYRNGDETNRFGGTSIEGTLPEDMLSKLNEWNQLVSSSLSEAPKLLTSFGPSKNDPVMILAISNSQCLLAELNANKFGVAVALWNSILKKA